MPALNVPNPLRQPNRLEKLRQQVGLDRRHGRGKVIHTVQRWLVYLALFVAGFVVAKLHSLVALSS